MILVFVSCLLSSFAGCFSCWYSDLLLVLFGFGWLFVCLF